MHVLANNDGNWSQENSLIFAILLAKTLFNIQTCGGLIINIINNKLINTAFKLNI